jgi:hypothetical protein
LLQLASDGGRVCRPLIICDKGVPRVRDEHLKVGFTAGLPPLPLLAG